MALDLLILCFILLNYMWLYRNIWLYVFLFFHMILYCVYIYIYVIDNYIVAYLCVHVSSCIYESTGVLTQVESLFGSDILIGAHHAKHNVYCHSNLVIWYLYFPCSVFSSSRFLICLRSFFNLCVCLWWELLRVFVLMLLLAMTGAAAQYCVDFVLDISDI